MALQEVSNNVGAAHGTDEVLDLIVNEVVWLVDTPSAYFTLLGAGVLMPRVTMAVDGRQALETMNRDAFDLVLLDIMLPVMNGYEVLEHLKASESLSHIPVIITTALDEMDGKAKCIELGPKIT